MRAHRTDLVSLAFGLLFVGLAGWWLVARLLGFVLPPVGWFLAGALLLIGVLGLVGALRAARSAGPEATVPAAGAPPAVVPDAGGTTVAATTPGQPAEAGFGAFDRTGGGDRWPAGREWDVPAPLAGAAGTGGAGAPGTDEWPGAPAAGSREETDEWPTDAVTDRRDEAVEDRPADVPGEVPPAPPAGNGPR